MNTTLRSIGRGTAAAILVALACAAPLAAQQDDAARLLSQGRDAYEAGDYESARESLWAYLDATARVTGPSRLPQAEALWYIALMEPDAAVAANHYRTIVDEYPAASVADRALFRLAVYELVSGEPERAREQLITLRRDYPFSGVQPEIPMWIGRTYLVEGDEDAAVEAFLAGYTKVKAQDLPTELPVQQREALAAEYAYWLAASHAQEGDLSTARQYYTLLTLDYPDSPQAADAREALARIGRGEAPVTGDVAMADDAAGRTDRGMIGGRDEAREPAEIDDAPPAEPREIPPVESRRPAEEPADRDPVADLEVVERGEVEPREEPPAEERRPVAVDRAPEPEPAREESRRGPEVRVDDPAKFPGPAAGNTWLQVGAFSSASNAADLSKRLKADGFDTRVEVGIVDGQGFYRVRVGPYDMPAESVRMRETRDRLDAMGYPTRLVSDAE
ncbi:MAG: SPOR domain-containing protein [Gemmatimonadota bacterium]|nr:SPOR domain-containing protein [Gemmatimonadota bacterium]